MCEIEPKPLGALCKKISTEKSVQKIAIFFGSGRMGSFPATSWREIGFGFTYTTYVVMFGV